MGQFLDEAPRGTFLDEAAPPPAAPVADKPGVGEILLKNLKAAPGRMASQIGADVAGAASAITNPEPPKFSTALPLVVGGPASTVATRLGAFAAGKMLDEPSTDPMTNITNAAKGLVGDWRKPMSMMLSPAAMEALFGGAIPLAGKAYRSTAAGKSAIAADDAARVGEAMNEVAPTLRPGTTAARMQRTAEGRGLAKIGAAKEETVQDITSRLPGDMEAGRGAGQIPVPSMDTTGGVSGSRTVRTATERPFDPELGAQAPQVSTIRAPIASGGRSSFSIPEANAELSRIGGMMRGRLPLDPRYKDVDLAQAYGQLANEIRDGIRSVAGPEAAAQWDASQAAYMSGRAVNKLLQRPTLFNEGEFNVVSLQKFLTNPANRALLAKKLGGDLATGENLGPYNRLVNSITRGAEPGMVDRVVSKPLGLMDTSGSGGAVARGFRLAAKAFPNASTSYVGQVPYSPLPPRGDIQTLLDLMGERAVGR